MLTLLATTALALTHLTSGPVLSEQGGAGTVQKSFGPVLKAAKPSEGTIAGSLSSAAGLKKPIAWQTVASLGPDRVRDGGAYLVFFKPYCVDANGLADLLGLPGGWNSEPGDDQSYLRASFYVEAGKRYGIVFDISRYDGDVPTAQFELDAPGGLQRKSLTGAGHLYFSFVPTASGTSGFFLRMSNKGRYLLRSIQVRRANA